MSRFAGDLCEGVDLGFGEEQAAVFGAERRGAGLNLARQHGRLVAMGEDVGDDGSDVFVLRAAEREAVAAEGLRVDALEIEAACPFFTGRDLAPAVAKGGEAAADVRGVKLVDQREAVALRAVEL